MSFISRRLSVGLAVLAVSAGCNEGEVLGIPESSGAYGLLDRGLLAVYNGGVDRAAPAQPCLADARYRQFDFWLGDWDVTAANGQGGSTNQITAGLDGCLVSENWTAANGIRGRSINAYDADLQQWHQTWVSSIPAGHLRMGGGLEADTMVLLGKRVTATGVELFDDYRWHVLPTGQVVQRWKLDIPATDQHFAGALTYTRTDTLAPPAETQTTNCRAGGPAQNARQVDFFLGTWTVSAEQGPALGTASITSDLSGCLTEENYATGKGYAATSFFYWDPVARSWWRTYVDSEGQRIELRGGLVDGRLVLTGTEPAHDGRSVQVRMTLESVSASVVRQEWAVSEDGEVWETEMSLVFTRA
jgi:hypothetical protein